MSKNVSYADYMNALSERVVDNTQQLKRGLHQRRNGMEDLYGVCFSAHATEADSSGRYNARFYISLSPDYVYLHRFAFKLVIMPSITEDEDPSEGRDWKMSIAGVDITDYLREQHNGEWIEGEGVYPTTALESLIEDFYDILDVVSVMTAEGKTSEVNAIMSPRFKRVIISSKKPFSVDAYLYVKFSTLNR